MSEIDVADELLGDMTLADFEGDEKTKRAVCMTVINIGELVKNITDDTREKYKKLPWKVAAGFRDVAAHKYQTLQMGDVFSTLKDDFPSFREQLQHIIDTETDEFV
ncbi:MAG: DUF86 domain-containing protein [Lachnospiraceae bacterium]|nr:DUF86 domain-containing protein [Lachnospiraceae bacterium]